MDKFLSKSSDEEKRAQIEKSLKVSVEKIIQSSYKNGVSLGFINSVSSLIYQFAAKCVARDLLEFRNHSGRKNVSVDDAILITRKTKYYEIFKKRRSSVCETKQTKKKQINIY